MINKVQSTQQAQVLLRTKKRGRAAPRRAASPVITSSYMDRAGLALHNKTSAKVKKVWRTCLPQAVINQVMGLFVQHTTVTGVFT